MTNKCDPAALGGGNTTYGSIGCNDDYVNPMNADYASSMPALGNGEASTIIRFLYFTSLSHPLSAGIGRENAHIILIPSGALVLLAVEYVTSPAGIWTSGAQATGPYTSSGVYGVHATPSNAGSPAAPAVTISCAPAAPWPEPLAHSLLLPLLSWLPAGLA